MGSYESTISSPYFLGAGKQFREMFKKVVRRPECRLLLMFIPADSNKLKSREILSIRSLILAFLFFMKSS